MFNFIFSLLSFSANITYFPSLDNFNNYLSHYNKQYSDTEYWYRYTIYEKNMD